MTKGRLPIRDVKPVSGRRADGTVIVRYYHRKTGRRMPGDPALPEFARALEANNRDAAFDGAPPPVETLADLMREYEKSPEWKKLANSTKAIESLHMAAIAARFGDLTLADIERKGSRAMFLEWRDEIAEDHPRAADAKLGRLQTILKFGCDRERLDRNPIASFRRVYRVDRSEVIWLPRHFTKLSLVAPAEVMLGAFVALHTGQRRGDLLALRWRQYDGERIKLTQQKTGARVDIRCTRALKATLDALRAERHPEPGDHVLLSPRGHPWKLEAWRTAWRRAIVDADLPPVIVERKNGTPVSLDLHFHDIRGTSVTMLAEAGCTIPEIAAVTGHSLAGATRILDLYLGTTKAMADAAITKFESKLSSSDFTFGTWENKKFS